MPPDFTTKSEVSKQLSARQRLPPRRNRHERARLEKAHLRSGGGATICCLYLSGEPSLRLPARVAPPPFAPLRGASSRTDWLGASGRQADIRCGCRMVACSSWPPAPYGRAREVCSNQPTYRSQISELALCSIFSSAARGRAPFGAERFFVRGGAPKMTAGTYNKSRNAHLAAAVLEIKEP